MYSFSSGWLDATNCDCFEVTIRCQEVGLLEADDLLQGHHVMSSGRLLTRASSWWGCRRPFCRCWRHMLLSGGRFVTSIWRGPSRWSCGWEILCLQGAWSSTHVSYLPVFRQNGYDFSRKNCWATYISFSKQSHPNMIQEGRIFELLWFAEHIRFL